MCEMNAAGAIHQRLAPGRRQIGNVRSKGDDGCWKSVETFETNRGIAENFDDLNVRNGSRRSAESFANGIGIADESNHDFAARGVGDDVGRVASGDRANVHRARAKERIDRQWNIAEAVEHVEKRLDGGTAEFGVRGVRSAAVGGDFVTQNALRAESELAFGGLAIHEKRGTSRRARGSF